MSTDITIAAETPNPWASRLWWAIPAVILLLLPLLGVIFGGGPEKVAYGTSYDASDRGFRGIYLILEDLGYPVERSRRPTGGDVRWILFPNKTSKKEARAIDDWIQRGGCALLAISDSEFANHIGFTVTVSGGAAEKFELEEENPFASNTSKHFEKGSAHEAHAPGATLVYASQLYVKGPSSGQTWGQLEDKPLVTIYQRGRGELWLLNSPDVLTNANLRDGDNSKLACRLAEAMLAKRPRGRLAFDEYCHGLHDRPNVFELLFTPPVLATTLEASFLTLLALWHFGIRFGSLRPAPPPPRRSKEEFLDALAELLTRKGDRAEAFRTIRNEFVRRLEENLSLPAGTPPEELVREAVRRRGVQAEPLLQLLTASAPPQGKSAAAFLNILHQLEIAANECFQSRARAR